MKAKKAYILLIALIVIVALLVFFKFYSPSRASVDMRQQIKNELSNGYSIREYDWGVWSKTARDSGLILTKMDSWEQFKESWKQNPYGIVIMLDEQNHVVWFKPYYNQAIYYQY
ncbi:hypothetical protein KAU88_07670 [Candidatus Bathyarchaeota archaeon]|nr:hypothetical protein [Candidatus Bathyarchaeota archaeon]